MWKVPLFKIYSDRNDQDSISHVIKRGRDWAVGPEIKEFEDNITRFTGTKHCVVFNSGTSALHATLLSHKVKQGSGVAVPSFSFISTANSVLFVNARPVFVDIEKEKLGMDPEKLEHTIKKQKINAIIPVHYAGQSCKIDEIVDIAKRKKILVIEDAAESLGTTYKKKMTGTFGDSAILSFAPNKVITTGEGGAVLTNSREIYQRLLLVRSHGRDDVTNYFASSGQADYVSLGYNFRMPSAIAALGISQLKKIRKIINMRRRVAAFYNKQFSGIEDIVTPKPGKNFDHVYQLYSIIIKNGKRDELARHLGKAGIMSKVYFQPIHLTRFYKKLYGFKGGELPVTEQTSKEILTLPLYPHMSKRDMSFVASEVRKFFEK
ncbi:Pyridoxal phosphate-dependent aminotransferase, cell wall synthesis related [Nitrosotalea devaniterrae]|uniref:Pyridoxal phosphate-dependent aminotransferase, cell wall synthesis related n=1 Tax=Nitrosotalea devaniterrae TaxID=1078905 RepID=A0A128A0M9_9ARCH|nr:Pyridoxal phosphate-dependent aminotransferase, cell wall synthesis related [Candidatus Nitrosotalea devanaterra]